MITPDITEAGTAWCTGCGLHHARLEVSNLCAVCDPITYRDKSILHREVALKIAHVTSTRMLDTVRMRREAGLE